MKYRRLIINSVIDNSKSDVEILDIASKALKDSGSTKHKITIETTEAQLILEKTEAERLR